jgi:hypothetical protein
VDINLLLKIGLSMAIVIALSLIAEHVRPRVAGILAGFPLGLALSLFFYGQEQGADFAAASAPYALLGLVSIQSFVGGYYLGSRPGSLLRASLCALAAFFAVSAALRPLDVGLAGGLLIACASIALFHWLLRRIPEAQIEQRVRFGFGVLLFRAGLAAGVIVLVTGVAGLIGEEWAGLFAAFPYTLYPLLLIVHHAYQPRHVHAIIRVYPQGIGACVCYLPAVAISYPTLGVYWGTAVSLGVAALYLLAYSSLRARFATAKS